MSHQQKQEMFTWIFRGVIGMLITVCVFIFKEIWFETKAAHDSIIELRGDIKIEKTERELWQLHMQRRIERIEIKIDNNGN